MNSTTVRARLLIALLMMAGSISVLFLAPSATAAPTYSVNLTVSNSRPDVGETVRLSGKVTPAAPGKRVLVQGKAAGTGWVTIKKATLSASSTYKSSVRFSRAGRVALRVVKPASRKVAEGTSRVRALRVGDLLTAPVIVTKSLPAGAVGTAYSATIETADHRAGAFTIGSGSLPTGLSLHDQTGVVSGTPTTQGTFSFSVVFTDPDGLYYAQSLSITVGAAGSVPVISTTTLPAGSVGTPYSATLQTVGNKTGTWAVTVGALPAGLTLAPATGVISGTPTTAGAPSFTVRFTETATGLADTQALSITVAAAGAPVISTTTLPGGTAYTAYTATLQTVGNKTGTWGVTAGTLPAGLTLAAATGVISGTPTTAGAKSFTVGFIETATGLYDTQALSITIAAATAPVISTTTLPGGTVGTAYTATLQTVGNKPGTWSLPLGSTLPTGLTLAAATGVISGTPTTAGTKNFTVKFTQTGGLNDSQPLSIVIAAAPAPEISTTTLPPGAVTKPYTAPLQTVGNKTGTWSKTAGSFPTGLSLNASTGVISGTPTAAGTQTFTVKFTQVGGLTDSQVLSITVDPNTAPVISTTSLPAGEDGTPYTTTLHTVDNRTGTWSVSSGSLPAGLALNGATGVISGTPTTAGTTPFTVVFTTTGGLTDSQALSITIAVAAAPVISTTSMPAGTVGQAYTKTLQTVGNKAGTWSLASGSLPAGLSLNGTTGVVSGSPTTAGTSSFTVVFTATSGLTDSQALSIIVDPNTPPQISTTTLPQGVVGTAYSATLETVGNRTGTWSVSSGALPAGLSLNGATGVISGTPTTLGTANFMVLFTATGGLTDTGALAITVVAAP